MFGLISFIVVLLSIASGVQSQNLNRVNSSYNYLVPNYDFNKKEFLKDGPYYPFDLLVLWSWDDENEYYSCQNRTTSGDSTFCNRWTADEQSSNSKGSEKETGSCVCLENSMGPDYCTYWFCTQTEVEKAYYSRSSRYSDYREFYTTTNTDIEYTDCVCRYESSSGKYCQQWWCQETGKDGTTEIEEYNCGQSSFSGDFCTKWTGRIASDKEKEWSRCKCDRPQSNYCQYWTCFEKEHPRTYVVNFAWFLALSIVFTIILVLVYGCCLYKAGLAQAVTRCGYGMCIFVVVIFGGLVTGFCILAGGLIGIFTGFVWTVLAIVFVYKCKRKAESEAQTSTTVPDYYDNNQNKKTRQQAVYIPPQNAVAGTPVGYPVSATQQQQQQQEVLMQSYNYDYASTSPTAPPDDPAAVQPGNSQQYQYQQPPPSAAVQPGNMWQYQYQQPSPSAAASNQPVVYRTTFRKN